MIVTRRNFGALSMKAMELHDLSQRKLAEHFDIANGTLSGYVNKKHVPTARTVKKLKGKLIDLLDGGDLQHPLQTKTVETCDDVTALKSLMKKKGWKPRRAAGAVGVSRTSIQSWLQGKATPNDDSRKRLHELIKKYEASSDAESDVPPMAEAAPSDDDSPATKGDLNKLERILVEWTTAMRTLAAANSDRAKSDVQIRMIKAILNGDQEEPRA